tara:strand:- start:2284 stop:3012 length:729 start_codon:yes stop_codon:yes gene_type:complete
VKKPLQSAVAAVFLVFASAMPSKAMPVTVTQDIIFLFDSSGSLGSSGYQGQIDFMVDVVQNYGGDAQHPTRFGLIEFSSQTWERYDFFDNQDPAVIANFLNGLSHQGGSTYTRSGVQTAITAFTYNALNPADLRTLVLLTDGLPNPSSQHPCNSPSLKPHLDANGIQTHIIATGGASTNQIGSSLGCLVDDTATQITELSSFSDYSLFQQGFVVNSTAMPAPGMITIFAFGIAGIAAARRRG